MRRAEGIDHLVAEGRDPGPMAGVPVALKDLIDDAGMPNRLGASFPADAAPSSAPVVRRLGAAGAVIIGRTGLHEFAFGFTSENHWFGPVRNPWNASHSPGGSSGGSAAAVAAGITPIGIGTDTGGSVRVPAAMCGVMGLKVTHGRIPLAGVFPLVASLDTVGPIARSVGDLELAYRAMAGDDPSDPWSRPVPVDPSERLNARRVRLAVIEQWLRPPTSAAVAEGLHRFIEACTAAGIAVDRRDIPSLEPIPELGPAIGPEIMSVHGARFSEHPDRYGPDTAARIESVRDGTAADVIAAERWGTAAASELERLAQAGYDAVVCPTVGVLEKTIGVDDVDIDGVAVQHREALARFTSPINRMRVPALAAPVAGTPDPGVSIQLVGPAWSESRLLAIGRLLEKAGVIEARRPPIFFG
jgi:aspartyl-tRNA(Asn)/glutamyl-tRNA(Gln) amidotransferase subunit A